MAGVVMMVGVEDGNGWRGVGDGGDNDSWGGDGEDNDVELGLKKSKRFDPYCL